MTFEDKNEQVMTGRYFEIDIWQLYIMYLQDLLASREQMSGQINVEVDAAPQEDLTKILAELREDYETIVAKSQRDLEGWFQQKVKLTWETQHP